LDDFAERSSPVDLFLADLRYHQACDFQESRLHSPVGARQLDA
jgi:hypothetical protein